MIPSSEDPQVAREAREWVVRLASGTISAAELSTFKAWLAHDPGHRRAFEDERVLWQAMGAAESTLRAGLPPQAASSPWSPRRRGLLLAAAAMLAAVWLVPQYAWRLQADHRAGSTIRSLALEDGSEVVLDAGAAIAVEFDGQWRQVELLRGRAWFRVSDDDSRPFQVAALDGISRDVGTAFEVALSADEVATGVTEGRVDVTAGVRGVPVQVMAGQRVRYRRGGAVSMPEEVPLQRLASWRQGDIVLENLSLAEAFGEVARYRDAPVFVVGTLDERRPVSLTFRSTRPDAAIQALADMGKAKVRRLPGGMLLVHQ